MLAAVAKRYCYNLVSPGIFVELYFPKRVAYQAEVVTALREAVAGDTVKDYLKSYASDLPDELAAYPAVLDPKRYAGKRTETLTVEDVHRRIAMYQNHFFGWSTYSVEGAFLNTHVNPHMLQDELVQIVRLIFRFESRLDAAKAKGTQGIVQGIVSWLLANYRLAFPVLNENQKDRFLAEHVPLTESDRNYVHQNYMPIAAEVLKWFDDCVLFVFGYLARRFWKEVAKADKREDEIWVTSFFNLGINVLHPKDDAMDSDAQPKPPEVCDGRS
jgi:hypothetical protein